MARSRSIFADGRKVAEFSGDDCIWHDPEYYKPSKRSTLAAPAVMRDIGQYTSIIDGTVITSRSTHREHLKTHDVVEVGNERMASTAEKPAPTKDIGEAIKRRVEEVKALPQKAYDAQVQVQQAEHAAVASLVTAG